jgi:hypothetical protein
VLEFPAQAPLEFQRTSLPRFERALGGHLQALGGADDGVGLEPQARRVFSLILPDAATLEFWRMTADDPGECARRVAAFSRRLQP